MNDWEWNRTLAFIAACDLDNEVRQRLWRDDLVKSAIETKNLRRGDFVIDDFTGRFVHVTEVKVLGAHRVRITDTTGTPTTMPSDEIVTVAR